MHPDVEELASFVRERYGVEVCALPDAPVLFISGRRILIDCARLVSLRGEMYKALAQKLDPLLKSQASVTVVEF
jgi:hypothetical protein